MNEPMTSSQTLFKQAFSLLFLLCTLVLSQAMAQDETVSKLFREDAPLEVKMSYSFQEIKKNSESKTYIPTYFHYKNEGGTWDSVKVEVRARGNFRQDRCMFTPIKMKIPKGDRKGTILGGNKSLKLVLPCQNAKYSNDLILKEYLCYKLYEPVTPFYFHTRIVNITLTDLNDKQPKTYELKGILVEDDEEIAERFGGELRSDVNVNPIRHHDTTALKLDFFQYMIANTDWSSYYQHNIQLMQLANKQYIPLAYDFDMSGLVDAPYAGVSKEIPIQSVRERYFRGICRTDELYAYVRGFYLEKEEEIFKAYDYIADQMDPKEIEKSKNYLSGFFKTLKNDTQFKTDILLKCRQ
jgi:hypothetical protein